MNTMKWLLRREFWEHKGGFVWAPVVAAAIMVVLIAGLLGYGLASGKMAGPDGVSVTVNVNGQEVQKVVTDKVVPPQVRAQMADAAANSYIAIGTPILIVLPVVAFFYCLAALYDDRRDRSILFWKSLPISDTQTVVSKLATVLVAAPLISIGIAVLTSLVILLLTGLAASYHGLSLFGAVLSNPSFYLAPLYLVALVPIYMLWALPTVGWLMLVSSWAKSKVFLWAVGLPLIAAVLGKWLEYLVSMTYTGPALNIGWYMQRVLESILFNLVPGNWLMRGADLKQTANGSIDLASVVTYSWSTLGQPALWIGAAAGLAMLAAAIRLRRWRDEG